MYISEETLVDLTRRAENHQLTSQKSTDADLLNALQELKLHRELNGSLEEPTAIPEGIEVPADEVSLNPVEKVPPPSDDPNAV
jgi:hypothetical protein